MEQNKKYGFQYPIIDETKDYILGAERSAPFEIINESGDWTQWKPIYESQLKKTETFGCTNFGSLNQLECLLDYLFKWKVNFAERFQAIVSGQTETGNDPSKVYESIRKVGVIEEWKLPFTDEMDFQTYLSPKPMTADYLKDAKKFLEEYEYKHEYVYTPNVSLAEKQKLLLQALKRSPVGVSVYAWQLDNGLYTKPQKVKDNHWTVLIGAKENNYWLIYDSYEPHIKKLEWNFEMDIAKGIFIHKFTKKEKRKLSIMEQILKKIAEILAIFGIIINKKKEELKELKPVINKPPKPPEPEPKVSKLILWAKAIAIYENMKLYYANYNNPGAIKKLNGQFLKFKTYDEGFDYLLDYLTRAATGKHDAYPKGGNTTMLEFQKIYSPKNNKNDPVKYCSWICNQIGETPETLIKDIV